MFQVKDNLGRGVSYIVTSSAEINVVQGVLCTFIRSNMPLKISVHREMFVSRETLEPYSTLTHKDLEEYAPTCMVIGICTIRIDEYAAAYVFEEVENIRGGIARAVGKPGYIARIIDGSPVTTHVNALYGESGQFLQTGAHQSEVRGAILAPETRHPVQPRAKSTWITPSTEMDLGEVLIRSQSPIWRTSIGGPLPYGIYRSESPIYLIVYGDLVKITERFVFGLSCYDSIAEICRAMTLRENGAALIITPLLGCNNP